MTEFSHLDKVYFPKEGYTKGDLLSYYQKMAPFLLPYLKDRPVMLHRYPGGIESPDFYQKDVSSLKLPSFVKTISIQHHEKKVEYILIQNLSTLEYVINLGTIELHAFMSSLNHIEKPDYIVIDLDPEEIDFIHVVEVAKKIHEILDSFKVDNYPKTSGGRGLHICIPLKGKYTFEQARQFVQGIGMFIHEKIPDITSLERHPAKRQHKIYLDLLQNYETKTVIVPYSSRAKEKAPVSTPLKWSEVKKGLDPKGFNIETTPARLEKIGDIFKPVLGKGVNLIKAISYFEKKKTEEEETVRQHH